MKRSDERKEFLADVITTAVEGGTGYWAQVSQYQWVDTYGYLTEEGQDRVHVSVGERNGDEPRATLHELDDDESGYKPEGLELTLDVVARGIGRIQRGEVSLSDWYRDRILAASRENDAGQIDAGDADTIVQAGLLGEVRYG